MIVAYLVNQYPRVSHSFIRREIAALEELGVTVHRFSIRPCTQELVDARDFSELDKTTAILSSAPRLLWATIAQCLRKPLRFIRALREAWRLSLQSDRSVVAHVAYLAEASFLVRELKRRNVQHLHAHFGTNSAAVALLCCLLGGPSFSFTIHGPEEFDRAPLLALDRKVSQAKFVAVISDYGKSQLMRLVGREHHSRIHVVRCGLDRKLLDAEIVPVPETRRVVCIGRLGEQKGHFVLLDAISRLVRQGEKLEVVFVGDGELRPEIERNIQELGIGSHVTITGYVSQERVVEELCASRALVLPSLAEGLPVVIMEALALGRPVLSTYIAGIPELVVPGQNGWLVPAGSVEALTRALAEVLNCPVDVLQILSNQGTKIVRAQHDVTVSARQLQCLFTE